MNIETMVTQMIRILQQKFHKLEELKDLTAVQSTHIKSGNFPALSNILQKKEFIMEAINGLDLQFLEHYQSLKAECKVQSFEELDVKKYPVLALLKEHVGKVISLLRDIEEADGINQNQLQNDFEQLKEEMQKFNVERRSQKVMATYHKKYAEVQGIFVDNKDK